MASHKGPYRYFSTYRGFPFQTPTMLEAHSLEASASRILPLIPLVGLSPLLS